MNFTPEHIRAILLGKKRQTRRLTRLDDYTWIKGEIVLPNRERPVHLYSSIHYASGRFRYVVGRKYAVCPGRGLKQILYKPGDVYNPALFYWTNKKGQRESSEWVSYGDGVKPNDITDDVLRSFGYVPLYIQITQLRREWLQLISEADAQLEGVEPIDTYVIGYQQVWNELHPGKNVRWEMNPSVYVIDFTIAEVEA